MTPWIASSLLLAGALFSLVAALGVVRFGDFYARVHAATKASTFGFGLTALAVALTLGTSSAWLKALAAIAFLFVTLPIAAHLLGRAVYTKDTKADGQRERPPKNSQDDC